MGRIVTLWHEYFRRHRWRAHFFLGIVVLASALHASKLKIDAGWLTLFSPNNPVLREYLSIPPIGSPVFYIHSNAANTNEWFKKFDGKIAAYPSHNDDWKGFTLTTTDRQERERLVTAMRDEAQRQGLDFTGGEVILDEFRDSVQSDIFMSTISAVVLIAVLMLFAFRRVRALAAAIAYQCAGIIIAMGLYACWFRELNLLSGTVPCVLVGLGVDFSIHILYVWRQGCNADEIVSAIGRPMILAAGTTMAAFAMLSFATMAGFASMALLGTIGVFCCFGVTVLFLPVTLEKIPLRHISIESVVHKPAGRWRGKAAVPLVIILIIVAYIGIPELKKENNIQNLYNPNLPAIRAQKNMMASTGHYPSFLRVQTKTDYPEEFLLAVSSDSYSWKVAPAMSLERGTLQLTLLPKGDPFNNENLQNLSKEFRRATVGLGNDIRISGDAFLCNELDRRLVYGMAWAVAGMFGALLIAIWGLKSRRRFLILPVMAIVLLGLGGFMGLMNISVNAYTITLLPLILGIGVDDCFYILFSRSKDHRFCKHAVLMTTVTTVIGYGSLAFSDNRGFAMAGETAIIGLLVAYVCATILLQSLTEINEGK